MEGEVKEPNGKIEYGKGNDKRKDGVKVEHIKEANAMLAGIQGGANGRTFKQQADEGNIEGKNDKIGAPAGRFLAYKLATGNSKLEQGENDK